MPSTMNYNFPYPSEGDIANVPRDLKSLAEKIEMTILNLNMTELYSASSHSDSGTLSEKADDFYGILLVAKEPDNNIKTSMFYPSQLALNTNLVIKTFDFTDANKLAGCRVIIGSDGVTLTMFTYDGSFIESIYGIFRK